MPRDSAGLFVRGDAAFSTDRVYRYRLSRVWNARLACIIFVMLNPSTATERADDPTIRRCIGFAQTWGAGSLWIGNLFAFRATDPKRMFEAEDPAGPDNFLHLNAMSRDAVASGGKVICAWGAHGAHMGADEHFLKWLAAGAIPPFCLALTKDGLPRHPLYLPKDCVPQPYLGRPHA